MKQINLLLIICTLLTFSCASHKKVSKKKPELSQAELIKQRLEQSRRISERLKSLAKAAKESGAEKVRFVAGDMYLKASAALMEGDFQTANLVFEQLITLVPKDDFVKQKYAISLIKSTEFESAKKLLSEVFENSQKKNLKAGLVLAGIHASLGETKEARTVYSTLLKTHPKSEESCVFLGKSYALEGETKKAVKLLKRCEKKNPGKGIFSYYIGKMFVDKKSFKTALHYFKRSLKLDPNFTQSSLGLGLVYEELGQLKKAEMTYKEHIKSYPENTVVLSRLVQLMFARKQFSEVIQYAEMLSDYEPDNLNLKAKLAILYKDIKNYDKAVKGFKHLISIAPDNEDLHYYLGSIYQEMKSFDEALNSFGKISEKSGLYQDSTLQIAQILSALAQQDTARYGSRFLSFTSDKAKELPELGVDFALMQTTFHEAQGDNLKAISSLKEVEKKKSFGVDHRFYLASLYEKEKDFVASEKEIKAILELEPENAHAWNFLGYSYLERGVEMKKAFEFITKAVKLSPKDGYIRDSLGWYHYKQGNLKEALKELKLATQAVPNDVAINKHMAIIYVALKNFKKAKFFIGTALTSASSDSERESLVQVLKDLEKNRIPASFKAQ